MSASNHVYTGLWTNWYDGRVRGATCTLSAQNGAYLVAFLALFVRIVGGRSWILLRFLIFRLRSKPVARDGLFHQQQAVLRNSANETDALTDSWNMLLAWRSRIAKPVRRLSPVAIIAIVNLVAFSVAGLFSSRVLATRSEVVVTSQNCGPFDLNLYQEDKDRVRSAEKILKYNEYTKTSNTFALDLAKRCYNGTDILDSTACQVLGRRLVNFKMTRNESCPFSDRICRGAPTITLDSGKIDSLYHLGINSKPQERFAIKWKSTCSALNVTDYVRRREQDSSVIAGIPSSTNVTFNNLYLGQNSNIPMKDVTFSVSNTTTGFPVQGVIGLRGFERLYVDIAAVSYSNGRRVTGNFNPIKDLVIPNGYLHLLILGNKAQFGRPVHDPWFEATDPYPQPTRAPLYISDQTISVLGCVSKAYECPVASPGGTRDGSKAPACIETVPQNRLNYTTFLQEKMRAGISGFPGALAYHGRNALLADSVENGGTVSIPDNQWELELQNMYATALIGYQMSNFLFVGNVDRVPIDRKPVPAEQQWMCSNQVVPSDAYSSFSVLGLGILLGIGSAIIVLSWFIDDLVHHLQMPSKRNNYRKHDWSVMALLQLQRAAFDARRRGLWTGTTSVPTTLNGDKFEVPDLIDSPTDAEKHGKAAGGHSLKTSDGSDTTVTSVQEYTSPHAADTANLLRPQNMPTGYTRDMLPSRAMYQQRPGAGVDATPWERIVDFAVGPMKTVRSASPASKRTSLEYDPVQEEQFSPVGFGLPPGTVWR